MIIHIKKNSPVQVHASAKQIILFPVTFYHDHLPCPILFFFLHSQKSLNLSKRSVFIQPNQNNKRHFLTSRVLNRLVKVHCRSTCVIRRYVDLDNKENANLLLLSSYLLTTCRSRSPQHEAGRGRSLFEGLGVKPTF